MNLKDYPRRTYVIDQFTQPHNSELMGKSFYFVMDDGHDYELNFTGINTVMWNYAGKTPKEATFQCLKGDDTTYLLDFELAEFIDKPFEREDHFFIIDLEQRLVTMAICKIGENPRFPYLVSSKYIFGAIKTEGMPLPFKRHVFTADMVGTRVEWHWNTAMTTRHCYYTSSFYRITSETMDGMEQDRGTRPSHILPSSDEIAQFIKIKDNLYLFSLVEEKMERAMHDQNPTYRSNDMKFLQNYDRMCHVGRTFGSIKEGGLESESTNVIRCYILFGAFGNPIKLSDEFLNSSNPYAP